MALHKLASISPQDLQAQSAIGRLQLLIEALRPRRGSSEAQIAAQFDSLIKLLEREPLIAARMHEALLEVLQGTRQTSLYAESGSLPERGFLAELMRRINHSVLPDLSDHEDLQGVVSELITRRDADWIATISDDNWLQLAQLLMRTPQGTGPVPEAQHLPHVLEELLDSVQLLSLRIAARGLDPEMALLDPTLLENESAFTAQQIESLRWLAAYKAHYLAPAPSDPQLCSLDLEGDYKPLCVLWQQGVDLGDKLHRRASRLGTSMHLSQTLATLRQKLERIAALSALAMHELQCHCQRQPFCARIEHIHLMKALLAGERAQ